MKEREELSRKIENILQRLNIAASLVIVERLANITADTNVFEAYSEDSKKIEQEILKLYNEILTEAQTEYKNSAEEINQDNEKYYILAGLALIPYANNKTLKKSVKTAINSLKDTLQNVSGTTAIGLQVGNKVVPIKNAYITIINKAVQYVVSGGDYKTAISGIVKELGQGSRLIYPTGHSLRIDSAVRMNVLDGMRQMNREIRKQQGQEFGADGVYIMPHGLCAPDHLPYQGKEYTYEEWDRLNSLLSRPIGTGIMNCGHVAYDVIVGASEKPYTDKQLQDIDDYSMEKVTWNGKELTRYEASQKMRNAETRIRELKDIKAVYKASGDKLNEARYKKYIKEATDKYKSRCEEAGLKARLDRL